MPKVTGKGSVIQRDTSVSRNKCKVWELRVPVGRDLGSGEYKPISKRFHGTLSEANKALRELITQVEQGCVLRRSDMRFGEYADAWIEECKTTLAYNTWTHYQGRMKHIKHHLSDARLSEITPEVLTGVYKKLLEGDSASGNKLNENYVADIATTLHKLFWCAVKDRHIPSNPCDYAERPKIVRKERRTIRAAKIKTLLSKLDPIEPCQLVVIMAVKTGMRRGEVHGLSWGDVDLDELSINIRRNYTDAGELKEPKTEKGERIIPIPTSLIDDLMVRRVKQMEYATAHDLKVTEDTPLISNQFLERILPHASTRWWDRNRESLGFPSITLHELRHSYLSEMARRKVDPHVLQKLAGHAKFSTTADIYIHVDMEDKEEAVSKMDW